MLGIIMQLKISARLIPQVTTIIYHQMKKKILLNKRKKYKKIKNKIQKYGGLRILLNYLKRLIFLNMYLQYFFTLVY